MRWIFSLATILVLSMAPMAQPASEPVDLELILAVDVSGSIDPDEARMQREGYIAAFSSPQVIDAIRHGFHGRIAMLYFEWAGLGYNRLLADWSVIHDAASAAAFRTILERTPPERMPRTSISQAIDYALPQFARSGHQGKRRVIDISGDGPNNWGRSVTEARDEAVAAGITINGLPIVNDRPSFGSPQAANLDLYYTDCVIGGPSTFIIVAQGFEDFARAVRRKLILEIAGRTPEEMPEAVRFADLDGGWIEAQNRQSRVAPACGNEIRRFLDN